MMRSSGFTHDFLLLFAAPIIWAVHFLFIYAFTGLSCAHGFAHARWLGLDAITVAIAGGSAAAIAIIGWTLQRMPAGTDTFLRWSAIALGLLSTVAIVWEALPVFMVPACG